MSTSPEPRTDACQGRSLNQCQNLYNSLLQSGPPPGFIRAPIARNVPRALDIPSSGRPPSLEVGPASAPFMGTRYQEIQPKPAGLGSILNSPSPGEPPRKKRGRPTKAETEERKEAARQRGEHYPPMRRENTASSAPAGPSASSGPSLAATQAARAVMTPQPPEAPKSDPSESSSGRRRRKQAKLGHVPQESREESVPMRAAQVTQSRGYPDILSRDPEEGPSRPSFRAPRAKE